MQGIIDLFSNQFWWSFWTLLAVVFIEKKLPWPDKFHPLSLYKLFTLRMAEKVLPSKDDSTQQKIISGSLASVILLLPVCVIIAVFIYLSEYPLFFQGVFLLIALRFQDIQKTSTKVHDALAADKKILARHTLQPIVLRETDTLSPMGLVKATSETLILRFSYQYCTVIFWYILTGGVGALIYRLLYVSAQNWNVKLKRFEHFGLIVNKSVQILQWLPNILAGLSLLVASVRLASIKALIAKKGWKQSRLFLLNIAGAGLNIQLGGPAIYENNKVRGTKCGGTQEVVLTDIKRTQNIINLASYLWLTLCFLGYTLLFINIT